MNNIVSKNGNIHDSKTPDSLEECWKLIDELKAQQLKLHIANDELLKKNELSKSQEKKQIHFYNNSFSCYFTLNRNGIILDLNQNASEFIGKPVDQLKGQLLSSFLDKFSNQDFEKFISNTFNSSSKIKGTVTLKLHRGIPIDYHIEGISLSDGSECLIEIVNISGQIKILHKLAESEMRYQQLLENLSEGIGIVDLDETFIYANPAGELIFGASPGELRNRNLREFTNIDQFSIIQLESKKRGQGEKNNYELDIVTSEGVKKTILISGSPHYDKKGNRIGTLGMFTDITEKKNDERELQRRLKFELIVSEISNDFVHLERKYLDHSVNRALEKIGNFAGVDRSYIFLFADGGLFCNNTHEWCAEGIEPQIENLKDVPLDLMPWWMDKLKKFETIHIPLVADLPPEAQAEKEILEAQDIKSLLVIPLLTSDSVIGFLGFDSVAEIKEWQDQDILLLSMLGEILGNGFGRMKYEEDLVLMNTQLELKIEERTQDINNLLEFNRGILRTIPDLLFRINKDGIYLDFYSPSDAQTYVSKEVFIGKSIRETLPTDLAEISLAAIENAFVSSKVIIYEYPLKQNGENKFYENRIVTISENEALSIIRDITDRKLAEESLRTTTQNLTILIENLHAGTLFEDETRHIYMVNQSFCNLFGIDAPPEALVGFDCAVASESSKHLMTEPDRFIERIDEIILDRKIVTSDELNLNDGRVFERDYIPILYNDDLLGHLWQYRDITDRKLNERYAIIQRDLGFSLAATTTIEQALSQVIQSTLRIEGIHAVGVYLIDQQTGSLDLILHEGLSPEFVESVRSYKQNHVQFGIVRKGEPVYEFYNDIFKNSELFTYDNLKQIGIIPIKHEGKIIGSVNIASRSTERFKYAAQISVEIIAAQIGGTLARISMENALRLSQQNFHLMFDTIGDFMFILDAEGKIIKTNPVVERRLGYTQEELQGMSVLEVHPPERREEAAFIVGEMLAGRLEVCPVPLYKRNGETIPVETKVVNGKWNGADALYGISRDISERLKAEESLRKSEERWHFALEGAGDGVWDWNILKEEVYFSNHWKTMLGYDINEIGNKLEEWEKRVHPDDLQNCLLDLNKHLNGETEDYVNEHRLLCKDGTYKWILDRAKVVAFSSDRKPIRIIGTHTDISQRKLYEEQLHIAIEREKELNELKSRFVSTASHEFRTPLASILFANDILLSYRKRMDDSEIAGMLGSIKEHVLGLTSIVNNILQLSKIQQGEISFNPIAIDLIGMYHQIILQLDLTGQINNCITFNTPFKTLIVRVDNQLMIQSITNLISNAIKYSTNDPKIMIELKIQDEKLIFNVQDNGIGIPESEQIKIFTPFFRAENASTIPGNGLGLSIVKDAVQMNGGQISFVSKPGIGTTFSMLFPLEIISSYS